MQRKTKEKIVKFYRDAMKKQSPRREHDFGLYLTEEKLLNKPEEWGGALEKYNAFECPFNHEAQMEKLPGVTLGNASVAADLVYEGVWEPPITNGNLIRW